MCIYLLLGQSFSNGAFAAGVRLLGLLNLVSLDVTSTDQHALEST